MVFRPYLGNGEMLTSAIVDRMKATTADLTAEQAALYRAVATSPREVRLLNQITGATNPEVWRMQPPGVAKAAATAVTHDVLSKLLKVGTEEKACVFDSQGVEKPVNNVEELARVLMGDKGKNLARGLAWHVPRIVSGMPVTTVEIVETFKSTWDKENGKLRPLFEAYFTSNTYSCAKSVTGSTK